MKETVLHAAMQQVKSNIVAIVMLLVEKRLTTDMATTQHAISEVRGKPRASQMHLLAPTVGC
jgi:hypothetical protein